jgi:hypothetical protein
MKIRITKEDRDFSNMIRERDGWMCQFCGRTKAQGWQIDCAHIYGRRDVMLRTDPDNALALCRRCHMEFTEHPAAFIEFVMKHVGMETFERLSDVHNRKRDRV